MNQEHTLPVTSDSPLYIEDIGFYSSLGCGWEINGAAMMLGYNGRYDEVARCALDRKVRGYRRLTSLLKDSIREIDTKDVGYVLLCTSEPTRVGLIADIHLKQLSEALLDDEEIRQRIGGKPLSVINNGRASLVYAFEKANAVLNQSVDKVLVLFVDTYLMSGTLSALANPPYRERIPHKLRVLIPERNSDGFIPGEAVGGMILSRQPHKADLKVLGTSIQYERALIDTSDVLKGQALTAAYRQVSDRAATPLHECRYRMASISGEQYFFKEAGLAQTRALTQKTESQPLWLPASYIGETGASVGLGMITMARYANQRSMAPGAHVIAHCSNDDSARGAFIMEYTGEHHG
ncbi:hypothetical protein M3I01_008630 [Marinomonas sp. RSW2]|uniref:Uncharacterized protein n=1 Tax=Marinomonas maritima TaxID=2940935 RepID=A0ABT5WDV2_9GAMM|nr:hypothetical protein [Marinomonas maritima]MDE8602988.1 hypothetical protein [Marinomonas maritima]